MRKIHENPEKYMILVKKEHIKTLKNTLETQKTY